MPKSPQAGLPEYFCHGLGIWKDRLTLTCVQSTVDWPRIVDRKSDKIGLMIERVKGQGLSTQYLGFFECFNAQLFFEAHEVLEELWLKERGGVKDLFYKGLIQLAGAFVHVQKHRPGPAAALFKLAQTNLSKYPSFYEGLALPSLLALIAQWLPRVESGELLTHSLRPTDFPKLPRPG